MFSQLKKVLNQEDEKRKRKEELKQQQERDAREILSKVGPAPALPAALAGMMGGLGHPGVPPPPPKKIMSPGSSPFPHPGAPVIQVPSAVPQKRPRSPSPGASGLSPSYYSSPKQVLSGASPYRSPNQAYLGPPPAKIPSQSSYGAQTVSLPPPPPPPRMSGQHITPGGIPIVLPQKQAGGITSGFPVHKQGPIQQPKAQLYGYPGRPPFASGSGIR